MQGEATTGIVLDTRRSKNDDTYPVKLRLTKNRIRRYYNIGYFLSEDDFTKIMGKKPRGKFKDIRIALNGIEAEAQAEINSMPVFSFETFRNNFFDSIDYTNLFDALKYWVKEYMKQGRPGTSSSFQSTLKSWQLFYKKSSLPFTNVTPKLLQEFEQFMQSKGRSSTTIGIYQRNIRRLYNLAIDSGKIKREYYPFGAQERGLYKIPEAKNIKKALSIDDVRRIVEYIPEPGSPENFYRDMWVFSYLSNGMNLADICRLKYKNIDGDTIVFIRQKTAHNRKTIPVLVEKTSGIADIIAKWGNRPAVPGSYIFNILTDGLDPASELAKVKQFTKMLNKYINKIAVKIGINERITSYTARHSFATVLKLSGENVAYISEALGHSSLRTTENYLKSFDRNKRKEAAHKLTNW